MDSFNPVLYSAEENKFLLENVGTSPKVALFKSIPPGVNPRAVRPVLQEVFDREELEKVEKVEWIGIPAIKASINAFLTEDVKWEAEWKRTRGRVPRYPTMFTRDGKGRFHAAGPGSDSNMPRSWEDAQGGKHFFEVFLNGDPHMTDEADVPAAPKSLIHDEAKHRIECPICAHTESYNLDSRASFNAARGRMSKHLKKPKNETSLHAELHTNEFGA